MREQFEGYYQKLGLKIAYYRKLKGYTQEQLAEKLDMDTSFIGQIEAPNIHKHISLTTLFRIARALNVPPSQFLNFD